jgi:hypothetical protein
MTAKYKQAGPDSPAHLTTRIRAIENAANAKLQDKEKRRIVGTHTNKQTKQHTRIQGLTLNPQSTLLIPANGNHVLRATAIEP